MELQQWNENQLRVIGQVKKSLTKIEMKNSLIEFQFADIFN